MKKYWILALLAAAPLSTYGQQESQFTQYMYNPININPGYAASREVLSVFTLYRAQWVGLDGAPTTSVISVSSPIRGSKLGLGVSLLNDAIGPARENNIGIDLSYTINASRTLKVAFGIKASGNILNIDFNRLSLLDGEDYAFQDNIDNNFSPNIGSGVFVYSDRSYVGLSVPYILQTRHYDRYNNSGSSSIAADKAHWYLIAGHVFDLSTEVKFKPSMLARAVAGSPLQVDVSGNMLIGEVFTVGLAYRLNAAVSALAGFQLSDSLFVGYSYDMATTSLADYSYGSHEIFLRYELFKSFGGITSPRFF